MFLNQTYLQLILIGKKKKLLISLNILKMILKSLVLKFGTIHYENKNKNNLLLLSKRIRVNMKGKKIPIWRNWWYYMICQMLSKRIKSLTKLNKILKLFVNLTSQTYTYNFNKNLGVRLRVIDLGHFLTVMSQNIIIKEFKM